MKIGIISSMHHSEKMLEVGKELEKLGHTFVCSKFVNNFLGHDDEKKEEIKLDQKYNQDAIREFWHDMQDVDAVLALNLDRKGIKNYIGGNTFLELGFAHVLNKKIFLYYPIPDIHFYDTEIKAMRPVIINGDLTKIV
ncbi:MAG: hypothetical protein COT25_02315 [Candidatus Kerfeldbacteria bacterium CG08_land_8_20_14_0_20_42_7]|uniref:Maf-like protein n=1 Tax=Candidatus Kerfeldbacteria bacterium CG08_land_8_20_14_0_20_42_7 TaxID=2014245 RepID=A0A2H0YSZ4_9BACT|nr:MAG: hypothetical protein COT25_02315 [Candidatus Kerfeldbacteria bacterium CG08_land_8_20_14_0_20_42_7]